MSQSNPNNEKDEQWTYSKIEEQLMTQIRHVDDEKYLKLASKKMYEIPVHVPTPTFEIEVKDLSEELRTQLHTMIKESEKIQNWFRRAVGAMMESIKSVYYRTSVSSILKVKLVNEPNCPKKSLPEIDTALVSILHPDKAKRRFEEKEYERLTKLATSAKIQQTIRDECNDDVVEYGIRMILKEAKKEDKLIIQILAALFSAYTANPVNMAITAPSGEGKSYVLRKCSDLFPKSDIMLLTGMTEKSVFHGEGVSVIRNEETGEYEEVDEKASILRSERSSLERKIKRARESGERGAEVEQWQIDLENKENELRFIKDNVKKKIDLSHKILLFLDTPNVKVFEALMPLLSHDTPESEYRFVDTNDKTGMKTHVNILVGYPAVIYCQAVNSDQKSERGPELMRRFVFVNPTMTPEKYKSAIELSCDKFGMSSLLYEETVLSAEEKDAVRGLILILRGKILDICRNHQLGRNECIIPFHETIKKTAQHSKAFDMTIIERVLSFIQMLVLIKVQKRPYMRVLNLRESEDEREDSAHVIPLGLFVDFKDALNITEFVSAGTKPYVYAWFRDVYMRLWLDTPLAPEFKENSKGEKTYEPRRMLSIDSMIKATMTYTHKILSKSTIETYIANLQTGTLLEEMSSELDRRKKKYYPTENRVNVRIIEFLRNPDNPESEKVFVKNPSIFPTKEFVKQSIQREIDVHRSKGFDMSIHDHKGNVIDVDTLIERYYADPETAFTLTADMEEKELKGNEVEMAVLNPESKPQDLKQDPDPNPEPESESKTPEDERWEKTKQSAQEGLGGLNFTV